jgi:hypothetical protein
MPEQMKENNVKAPYKILEGKKSFNCKCNLKEITPIQIIVMSLFQTCIFLNSVNCGS